MLKKSHKLFEIVSRLNTEEWRSFKSFTISKSENGSDFSKLISYLYLNRKALSDSGFSQIVKGNLFSNYSQKRYSNTISKLYQIFQNWIVCYDLINSKFDKPLALIKSLNARGIYNEATRIAERLEQNILEDPYFDLDHSKLLYLIKNYQLYNFNPETKRADNLKEMVNYYNASYKEHIHLFNTELFNTGRIRKHDFTKLINANINRVSNLDITKHAILTKHLESLISKNDKGSFDFVYTSLLNGEISPQTALHDLCCAYCITAYASLLRNNEESDSSKLLALYNYALETEAILRDRKLTAIRFSNMISTMSVSLSYEEVDIFIENWVHLVDTKYTSTVKGISKAQNCFYHERYNEIIDHIRGLKFENKYQRLSVMRYELVAVYEQGDYDLLETLSNNFLRALKRNKKELSKKFIDVNKNLIMTFRMLVRSDFDHLVLLLKSGKPLVFRKWMEKKVKLKR